MADAPRGPETFRRPLGVLDADRTRAKRALDALCAPRPIRRDDEAAGRRPHRLLDTVRFAGLIVAGAVFIGVVEIRSAARRLTRRMRGRRHAPLDPDVLAQLRRRPPPSIRKV